MLQALIDKSQEAVTGRVTLKLYKGSASVIGRESPYSLYDQDLVTFEEGAVAYDHRDAAGFIRSTRSGCARSAHASVARASEAIAGLVQLYLGRGGPAIRIAFALWMLVPAHRL